MTQYTTLFLDRDGVINTRKPETYTRNIDEFIPIAGSIEALKILRPLFQRIFLVTNQQGIAKGLYTVEDLREIHNHLEGLAPGVFDKMFFCAQFARENPLCRKPNPGMAWRAQAVFPEVDFHRSIMVGDSLSDILFAQRLGMHSAFIRTEYELESVGREANFHCEDLYEFAKIMRRSHKNC